MTFVNFLDRPCPKVPPSFLQVPIQRLLCPCLPLQILPLDVLGRVCAQLNLPPPVKAILPSRAAGKGEGGAEEDMHGDTEKGQEE